MKKFLIALAVFVLAASPALADTYPVYQDTEKIAEATVQNGVTYLPMRAVFELFGLNVEWQPEGQRIVATEYKAGQYVLQVGQKTATWYYDDGSVREEYTLQAAPYAKDGRVMLPLRAVSEMLNREVFWLKDQNCVMLAPDDCTVISASYDNWSMEWLVMKSGNIYDCVTEKWVTKPEEIAGWQWQISDINKTGGGNYVLTLEYTKAGEESRFANMWLNLQTGAKQTVWTKQEEWYWKSAKSAGEVEWILGINQAYVLDDKSGEVLREFDLQKLLLGADGNVNAAWAKAWANRLSDKALIFDDTRVHWGLLDWHTGKVEDISDGILTEDVKQRFNEKLWQYVREMPESKQYATQAEFLAEFWQDLRDDRYDNPNDKPYLMLEMQEPDDGKADVLYFKLSVMTDVYTNRYSEVLEYKL